MTILRTITLAFLALALVATDADARRFGGARSIGRQREAISPQRIAPRPPAQQPQQTTPSAPPPQQPPAPASRWLGPLAGLALGAGLASLLFHNGLAGVLSGLLMLLAAVGAFAFIVRALRARSVSQERIHYAGGPGSTEPTLQREPYQASSVPAPHSVAATTGEYAPAGFDAAEFVRHAKRNFVQLQTANDERNLETIRNVVTPELYPEIEAELNARGDAPQTTAVEKLDAQVLDVATEGDRYVVSVRFAGSIREDGDEPAHPFSEIWHLEKPVRGDSGWLVAGIQQG